MNTGKISQIRADLLPDVQGGLDIEDALRRLHRYGATPIEALYLVRELYGLSLGEAKSHLTASDAWASEVAAADVLHAEVLGSDK